MSYLQIHELFIDKETCRYRKMDISEFLEFLKPKDCQLNKEIVRTQVKEYQRTLMTNKRNDLIDKGMWKETKIMNV